LQRVARHEAARPELVEPGQGLAERPDDALDPGLDDGGHLARDHRLDRRELDADVGFGRRGGPGS
jgi:hypothetical protein